MLFLAPRVLSQRLITMPGSSPKSKSASRSPEPASGADQGVSLNIPLEADEARYSVAACV